MLKKKQVEKEQITKKQMVRDFVEWFGRKPFSYHDIVSQTGIDYDVVRVYINKFINQKLVKLVRIEGRKRFFVRNLIPENKGSPENNEWDFIPNKEKLIKIIEVAHNSTIKNIEQRTGYSHGLVHYYVSILVFIEAIRFKSYILKIHNSKLPDQLLSYKTYKRQYEKREAIKNQTIIEKYKTLKRFS